MLLQAIVMLPGFSEPKDLDASPDSYTQTIPDFMRYSEFILFWPDELNGKKLNADSEKRFDTAKFGGNVGNGAGAEVVNFLGINVGNL